MVLTYPHVVIRARLQDNRTELKDRNVKLTFWNTIKTSIDKEGVVGLYSGLRIDLIRCLPANAITFMTFEFAKSHLEKWLVSSESF
jgi:Mitochondrial carrier protein